MRIFTGSSETEGVLKNFMQHATELDAGVPKNLFIHDDYMWKVMTVGRNSPGDAYPGSMAPDDVGGFFIERDGLVYLTDKAKKCIWVG